MFKSNQGSLQARKEELHVSGGVRLLFGILEGQALNQSHLKSGSKVCQDAKE